MIPRTALAASLMTMAALAGPPLTTIQDTLYKADGTRFSGTAVITWRSFEAADTSNIPNQSLSVKITEGTLRVQLVPTTTSTPPTTYTVVYNSDGKVQFTETWSVPASTRALRVRDVRVTASTGTGTGSGGGSGSVGSGTTVLESDVVGLTNDLNQRPVKSSGYLAGRAVFVNLQGALESVAGDLGDCVRVDGSSGPCGGAQPGFVDAETPTGIVDGSNLVFTLANAPSPASSLAVYRNGILMKVGQDLTLENNTITFLPETAPQPGDTILAAYRSSGGDSETPRTYPAAQVICAGTGATTNETVSTSLGICTVPAGLLIPGDRIEIRWDLEHLGTTGGFTYSVRWGAVTITQRTGAAGDALVSGRADAAVHATGAQLSSQSWGTQLPLSATVSLATDPIAGEIVIEFFGNTSTAGADTLSLKSFTVLRFP
jgi:hypothetical protein